VAAGGVARGVGPRVRIRFASCGESAANLTFERAIGWSPARANGRLFGPNTKPTVSNTFLENPLTEEGYRYVVDYLGKRHKSSLGQQKIDFVTQILKFEGLQQFR